MLPLRPDDPKRAISLDEAQRVLEKTLPGVVAEGQLARITDDQTIVAGERLIEDRLSWIFWFSVHQCRGSTGPASESCGSAVIIDAISGQALLEIDSIG
jgi:hypothetical protein